MMKRWICVFAALAILLGCTAPVFAADGQVSYSGDAGEFIFAPGSDHSLTDLFPNFKGVMPGDSLQQTITVKNDASEQVKVKIYIRSLGAHEESKAFLSQLRLKVAVSQDNTMGYMFDAYASETAQLTDWVCLGMLYSGGEVNLDVTLEVPVEMGNAFQDQIGYLDWEFMVEEFPVDDDDPRPPQTGDETKLLLPIVGMIVSVSMLFLVLFIRRNNRKEG